MAWRELMVAVPIEDEGMVLEGVWQSGSGRGAVVAPPHPLYGGSLENPVGNEIAYALDQMGCPSRRFNWRGVGASQGVATLDPGVAERDCLAAIQHVVATVGAPVTAAGYSFGAATALRLALRDDRLSDLVLVAPPIEMIRSLDIERFEGPIRVLAGMHDDLAPVDQLSELFSSLPNVRVDVIPEADHFFAQSGLSELSTALQALR